jgi:hypothetical protein
MRSIIRADDADLFTQVQPQNARMQVRDMKVCLAGAVQQHRRLLIHATIIGNY